MTEGKTQNNSIVIIILAITLNLELIICKALQYYATDDKSIVSIVSLIAQVAFLIIIGLLAW